MLLSVSCLAISRAEEMRHEEKAVQLESAFLSF
jgi:hypothetical protein